ncbi:MAG: bifunctional (p)ppGpp synthetase/guanosine-3',5'-bis(diphosphate) 3'-pyrophosphohydrolase [Herbaspirillum sp.]
MVSVAAASQEGSASIVVGLGPGDSARVLDALAFVTPVYAGRQIPSGQDALQFAQGVVSVLSTLNVDAETRIAGLLFKLQALDPDAAATLEERFGKDIAGLVAGVCQLMRFHELTFQQSQEILRGKNAAQQVAAQIETLRKMLLAMAPDMRVVLLRLAARVTTLRHFAENRLENDITAQYARETFDLYAPLANRLGIWPLKWELEDLSFRFLEPATYRRIARMLEEKRMERTEFVARAIGRLRTELTAAEIKAEVSGRPKHIYSIWSKMRAKALAFSDLYDVQAFRVITDDVKDCYTVLGIVHDIWTPVPEEFDDYIARPKQNAYQSLHTVVTAEDGRPLEVQIRTREMHHFAEYGMAAHWRYKESGGSSFSAQQYDEKIAWLRQLLAWKSEVAGAVVEQEETRRDWVAKLKSATLDDRIYVLTPQARVIELPNGATPIDFAYCLHSDIGHCCRGARVDGVMMPLNTPLKNGQTIDIITVRNDPGAGPSRDWLSPGYVVSSRARAKLRAWFNAVEQQETLARGRAILEKTLQREGRTAINLEELARRLGFAKVDDLCLALGKDAFSPRQIEHILRAGEAVKQMEACITRKSRASSVMQGARPGVLVAGVEDLMTQLARCCKPVPPDGITGFVTRGKGVSIHRSSCKNLAEMHRKAPERIIQAAWGTLAGDTVYPVDIFVLAGERQGLLRDISDIFLREKVNVIGVRIRSVKGQARLGFTAEIGSTTPLQKALAVIREVEGVLEAGRQ